MDVSSSDSGGYKPSINIEQAPSVMAPMMHIATAYGFVIAAAVLLLANAPQVAHGLYGDSRVILMVHCFSLGFLSMTAMGVLQQWVPVVFDVPPLPLARVTANFLLYVVGILGFAWGLLQPQWVVLACAGTVIAVAILIWSAGVIGQLARSSRPRDIIDRGIQAAVIGFNVVWVLGIFMALSFLGWWPEYRVLPIHIGTALVGWMGFLVLTVQLKLNPMFSMSKGSGINPAVPLYLAAGGVLLAWVSLFTGMFLFRVGALLWTAAIIVTTVQSMLVVLHGKAKTFDRVFVGVAAGWFLLLAAAGLAMWLNPLAVLFAFWGFLTLIFSYQARIIPFIVALIVAKRTPGPIFKAFFMAQAMHSRHQPLAVGIMGVAGAVLSAMGRILVLPRLETAAGAVALLLIGSEIQALVSAMARGRKQAALRL